MREILFKAKRIDNGEIEGTELTFIKYITPRKALFQCGCGKETIQNLCDIEKGKAKSCGCKRYRDLAVRNKRHGEAGTRLYRIWRGIKTRCQNTNHKDYADYGMRGISICKEWCESYESFRNWALSNGYKENLTIERKDVNGNYEPSNCCWITKSEQSKNQRPRRTLCKRDEKGRFVKMREILFKAKSIATGEWVEGYVFDDGFVDSERLFVGGLVITDYKGTADDRWDVGLNFYEVNPDTLCQYTGLTDKNGNKIWENDILLDDIKSVVRWDDEEARFVIDDYGTKGCVMEYGFDEDAGGYGVVDTLGFDDFYTMQSFEVIGNKFDNPELLGV